MLRNILVFVLGGGLLSFFLIVIPLNLSSIDYMDYVNSRMKEAKEEGAARMELDVMFSGVMEKARKYKFNRARYYSLWSCLFLLPVIFLYGYKFSRKTITELLVVMFFSWLGYVVSNGNLLALGLIGIYLLGVKFNRRDRGNL